MSEDPNIIKPWIVWMWHRYVLEIHQCSTKEDAINRVVAIQALDEGSLHVIEGPNGQTVPLEEVAAAERRREELKLQKEVNTPKPTYRIEVAAPHGGGALWGFYMTKEEAEAAAVPLIKRFGERVRVHSI